MGLEDFDMEIKFSDGLEFVTDSESDDVDPVNSSFSKAQLEALKVIIRDGYRAPVGSADHICLMVAGKPYPVFNLSVSGLGIFLKELDGIKSNVVLKDMVLHINDAEFQIDGKVIHVSQDESHYLCGIHIVQMEDACQKELLAFLQNSRKLLFS
nr:PilZ domain-containing protein [Desulfobulbaceae bacterium]